MAEYLSLINRNTVDGRCDVTPIFADPAAFSALVEDMLAPFRNLGPEIVVGIDALGFIVGAALALRLKVGFVPIRKAGKLPVPADGEVFVDYSGLDKALELAKSSIKSGERVLIADEWVETGTQVSAAIRLVERQGGVVVGVAAINIDENERTLALRAKYFCRAACRAQ